MAIIPYHNGAGLKIIMGIHLVLSFHYNLTNLNTVNREYIATYIDSKMPTDSISEHLVLELS